MSDPSGHRLPITNIDNNDDNNDDVESAMNGDTDTDISSQRFDSTTATTTSAATTMAAFGTSASAASTITTTANTSSIRSDSSQTTTTTTSSNKIKAAPSLTLPDGRIIDGKNTLQSFESTDIGGGGRIGVKNTDGSTLKPPTFNLPDGRLIDGKNTLQSFGSSPLLFSATTPSSNYLAEEVVELTTSAQKQEPPVATDSVYSVPLSAVAERLQTIINPPMTALDPNTGTSNGHYEVNMEGSVEVYAEAVSVVDVEIANSQIQPLRDSKRRSTLFCVMIILVVTVVSVGVGIGAYCGTGNCDGSTYAPSKMPVSMTAAMPTTPGINPQLTVACEFLNTPNISDCQKLTFFTGKLLATTIPTELELLTQLTYLDLSINRLTGIIPSTLGNLTQLTHLDLSGNAMTGIIPSTLGNLMQLTYFDLSGNAMTSLIPSILGNLTQLTYLDLSFSEWTGIIPLTLGDLTQLTDLDLSINSLNGTIPLTLGNLVHLTDLNLSINSLNGTIPLTLGNLTQLNYLYLSNNQLSGTIPSTLGNLVQLSGLYLSGNQLTGSIPSTLCSNSGIIISIDCANITCTCCRDGSAESSCANT